MKPGIALAARKSVSWLFACSAFTLIPATSAAHGLIVYISTPFSPPAGHVIVPVVFSAMMFSWCLFCGRKYHIIPLRLRHLWLWFIVSTAAAMTVGIVFARMNTAPPPGFGLPSQPLYGQAATITGKVLWATGNAVGLALLVPYMFVAAHKLHFPRALRLRFVAGCVAVYLACSIPYFATGALLHGRPGGYTDSECTYNLENWTVALVAYASQNSGSLPQARDMNDLHHQLTPYFSQASPAGKGSIACPVDDAFYSNPPTYKWNASLAGMTTGTLASSPTLELISCRRPEHQPWRALRVAEFLEFCGGRQVFLKLSSADQPAYLRTRTSAIARTAGIRRKDPKMIHIVRLL